MISCRRQPTRKVSSSAKHHPPKAKTLRQKRGVFVLSLALIAPIPAAAQVVGDVYASDASVKGSVRETSDGLEVNNGVAITAGEHSATLRLARGGQVRVCPGTNLTVNASPQGQELMFAMSAGSLEADYSIPFLADVVLTPDYRILISGPADVSVSISANKNGDACVRSRGDNSYVVVSELMGDDFYHVKPDEQVVFHAGHVKDSEENSAMACGCPAPSPLQRVEAAPQEPAAPAQVAAGQPTATMPTVVPKSEPTMQPPSPGAQAQPQESVPTPQQKAEVAAAIRNEPAVAATASAAAGLPQQPAGPVQVQVDAPMVFKGSNTRPDVTATLARVHIERLPWPQTPAVSPQPPHKAKTGAEGQKRGFFKRFLHALFG